MAAQSSRQEMFTTEDVLTLLDQQEDVEDELRVDLDAESEDEDSPEGDFTTSDGIETLVQPELLVRNLSLVVDALDRQEPSQRDSVLPLDPSLCDNNMDNQSSKYTYSYLL